MDDDSLHTELTQFSCQTFSAWISQKKSKYIPIPGFKVQLTINLGLFLMFLSQIHITWDPPPTPSHWPRNQLMAASLSPGLPIAFNASFTFPSSKPKFVKSFGTVQEKLENSTKWKSPKKQNLKGLCYRNQGWWYKQPWELKTFIFRDYNYNSYIGGLQPSFFMVLGSKGTYQTQPWANMQLVFVSFVDTFCGRFSGMFHHKTCQGNFDLNDLAQPTDLKIKVWTAFFPTKKKITCNSHVITFFSTKNVCDHQKV